MENQKIIKHENLVRFVLKKLGFDLNNPEYEDLFQEGSIGLLKAIRTFDEDKKMKFSTYACKCILNEILCYCRARNCRIKMHGFKDTAEGMNLVYNIKDDYNAYKDIDTELFVDYIIKNVKNGDIFCDYAINELTQKELSEKYNKSQTQICRDIELARIALKCYLRG